MGRYQSRLQIHPKVSGLIPTRFGGVGRVGGSKHGAIDSEAIRHFKFVTVFSIIGVSAQTKCAKILMEIPMPAIALEYRTASGHPGR